MTEPTNSGYLLELEELGMDIEKIVHVLLVGQIEFIAEIIDDDKTTDHIFLNPIRVIRDAYIDGDGEYNCHNLLVGWNPCIKDPFIFIKPNSVISVSKPNEIAVEMYLGSVKEFYYPELYEEEMEIVLEEKKRFSDNIIDFQKYIKTS